MSATPAAADIAARLLGGAGRFRAVIEATEPGLLAGTAFVDPADSLGLDGTWRLLVQEGEAVAAGQSLVELAGPAEQLGVAEDFIMGPLGFASGVASRAAMFRKAAPASLTVACGGWKKLPASLKPLLRAGLAVAGVLPRLVDGQFVYVAKNSVIMLGGIETAITAGLAVGHGPVAIQVKSVEEAIAAIQFGAGIVMVDTGRIQDLAEIHEALLKRGSRSQIRLAFGGGVRLTDLEGVAQAGADAVDVGRAILDAPLLDLRMRVLPQGRGDD